MNDRCALWLGLIADRRLTGRGLVRSLPAMVADGVPPEEMVEALWACDTPESVRGLRMADIEAAIEAAPGLGCVLAWISARVLLMGEGR
jgi:hypothetical protein